jgi:hypothetical protein
MLLRFGKGRERRIRLSGKVLENILEEEQKVFLDLGGPPTFPPFRRPQLPEGYRRSFWHSGHPRHPKRYERSDVLEPGGYFRWPLLERIIIEDTKMRNLVVGPIYVLTSDSEHYNIEFFVQVNYRVLNIRKLYNSNHIPAYALGMLAQRVAADMSNGRPLADWADSKENHEVEQKMIIEVRKTATVDWGLQIPKDEIWYTSIARVAPYSIASHGPPIIREGDKMIGQHGARAA